MRIEAAAYRGRPVYFELIGPWTRPERMQPDQPGSAELATSVFFVVLLLSLLVTGLMLVRRNLRLGRGDRRAAFRLAVVVFAAWGVAWICGAHHVPTFYEFVLFIQFLSFGLLFSCLSWVFYVAVEPYVRRRWPATLVSWSRLMAGGFRDPLVGRDVLAGCLLGAFSIVLVRLGWFVPSWFGHPPPQPYSGPDWQFLGARTIIASISNRVILELFISLLFLFFLFLLRALLRKQWAAAIVYVVVTAIFYTTGNQADYAPVVLVSGLITNALTVFLLIRFGLLAVVAAGRLQRYPGELSTNHPNVLLVCGHEPGRDSAHGRDSDLCLLHLPGRPAGLRRRRPPGVSPYRSWLAQGGGEFGPRRCLPGRRGAACCARPRPAYGHELRPTAPLRVIGSVVYPRQKPHGAPFTVGFNWSGVPPVPPSEPEPRTSGPAAQN